MKIKKNSNVDINYESFDIDYLKSKHKHLQWVDVPSLNPGGASLIIGTDFPEFQIHFDFKSGEPHQPNLLKTKLGWVLLGGKSIASNLNSNNINTSFDTENFWNKES